MGYKLIACDMDETLLNDNHKICKRNIEMIKRAKVIWNLMH
ncbi:HAD family hydrolase [Caproiciproducens sp. MSJ-32]|nr:HAD hydrolase family protein [Caproiciproducens sp. MSJ-32]